MEKTIKSKAATKKTASSRPKAKKATLARSISANQILNKLVGASLAIVICELNKTLGLHLTEKSTAAFADLGVALVLSEKNGKLRVHSAGELKNLEDTRLTWYFDPSSGNLTLNRALAERRKLEAEKKNQHKKETLQRRRELSSTIQVHKLGERWFVVELAPMNDKGSFDCILGRPVTLADKYSLGELYGRHGCFAQQKRELTYSERRELNL